MASKRAALMPVDGLERTVREVVRPLQDTVARMSSANNTVNRLPSLSADATLSDVIAAYNALVKRIQED